MRGLLYYSFDFDDNLLHADTVVHMEKLSESGVWEPVNITTVEYAKVRTDKDHWRALNNDPQTAFIEFTDVGPRGNKALLEDVISAIERKAFAPSWNMFIKCLVNGNIFSIITARMHEPDSIRMAVEWIIHNYLTNEQRHKMLTKLLTFHKKFKTISSGYLIKDYLDTCEFIGVTSPSFIRNNSSVGVTLANPEFGKELAFSRFVARANKFGKRLNTSVKVGFSDDDVVNCDHIIRLVKKDLSNRYNIDYSIFNTSGNKIIETNI